MKWTRTVPTKPGYYWLYYLGDKDIVSVFKYDNEDLFWTVDYFGNCGPLSFGLKIDGVFFDEYPDALISGPIKEPVQEE